MNNVPQHGDTLVNQNGKATRPFQEFLDDMEYIVISRPPESDDGKTRKRVLNIWWNDTDATLEYEVI